MFILAWRCLRRGCLLGLFFPSGEDPSETACRMSAVVDTGMASTERSRSHFPETQRRRRCENSNHTVGDRGTLFTLLQHFAGYETRAHACSWLGSTVKDWCGWGGHVCGSSMLTTGHLQTPGQAGRLLALAGRRSGWVGAWCWLHCGMKLCELGEGEKLRGPATRHLPR